MLNSVVEITVDDTVHHVYLQYRNKYILQKTVK
jgi:hypothetical protein